MTKYIVTLTAKTRVAALVEADSEESAASVAEALAKTGQMDTLDRYVDPSDFVEVDLNSTVYDVEIAQSLGYEGYPVQNKL